jgi:hypothetical protein
MMAGAASGAASGKAIGATAANQARSMAAAISEENATVSVLDWVFQLVFAFMMGFLVGCLKHGARLASGDHTLNRKATNCGKHRMKSRQNGLFRSLPCVPEAIHLRLCLHLFTLV